MMGLQSAAMVMLSSGWRGPVGLVAALIERRVEGRATSTSAAGGSRVAVAGRGRDARQFLPTTDEHVLPEYGAHAWRGPRGEARRTVRVTPACGMTMDCEICVCRVWI